MWPHIGIITIAVTLAAAVAAACLGYRSSQPVSGLSDLLGLLVKILALIALCAVLLTILSSAMYQHQPGECGAASLAIYGPAVLLFAFGTPCIIGLGLVAYSVGWRIRKRDDRMS